MMLPPPPERPESVFIFPIKHQGLISPVPSGKIKSNYMKDFETARHIW